MKFLTIFMMHFASKIFAFNSPNAYFTFLDIQNDSIIRISYKLNIIKRTIFLKFIDESYDGFLFDFYSFTEKNNKRIVLFKKSDGSLFHDFLLIDKVDRKTLRHYFKFPFSQKFINKTNFCRQNWSCYGKIELFNFMLMDSHTLKNYEYPELAKYSRIDAHLQLCNNNLEDYSQETCDDDDLSIYIFITLSIILSLILISILCEIVVALRINLRKRTVIVDRYWIH